MTPLLICIYIAVVVVARIASAYGLRQGHLLRTIRNFRQVAIAKVREGERVKIVGRLRLAAPPLTAPLSKRACALYRVRIVHAENSSHASELLDLSNTVDFFVEDESSRALIRAEGFFDTIIVEDRNAHTRSVGADDPDVLEVLTKYGIYSKDVVIHEGVFEEGETIAVWGIARWELAADGTAADYRSSPLRLVLSPPDDHKLIMTDEPTLTSASRARFGLRI